MYHKINIIQSQISFNFSMDRIDFFDICTIQITITDDSDADSDGNNSCSNDHLCAIVVTLIALLCLFLTH